MSALLEVETVEVSYGGARVLRGVTMHARDADLVCLLGPSGCGKTTLLRAIAGFEPVAAGAIRLAGETVSDIDVCLPPERRPFGMVFQENALFPHLTVAGNTAFGLRHLASVERTRVVDETLEVVGLAGLQDRYVHQLSGGQQQRVALARAIARGPKLMLLDEPFSSLDGELRQRLGGEVRDILRARGITTVLVTHDQNEAFALADQIGVMSEGRILQWDTAYNLYHEPADRFIADFIGQGVFLRGTLAAADAVDTEIGTMRGNRAYAWPTGSVVDVLLRPDDIQPDTEGDIDAIVVGRAFKGAQILYSLRLDTGSVVLSLFPSHLDHRVGERVRVRADLDHLVAFPV